MRRLIFTFTVAGFVALATAGCSHKTLDTAKIRATFESTSSKDYIEQACQMIDQSNYVAALRPLKKVAYTAKLDKDQQLVLQDTLEMVQAKAAKQK